MSLLINKNNNEYEIDSIFYKVKNGSIVTIQSIYNGAKLIWSNIKTVLSAFGAGFWVNDMPWSNQDSWKND